MREYRKDLQFNLISEKEAKRHLKQKGVKIMLYFVTEDKEVASLKQINDSVIKSLLQKFDDVLQNDLSKKLPSVRDIDHAIDTDVERSFNRNDFSLSEQQLRKQTKQVKGLLKRKLIRKSISS